jgi:erythronate-4-phosphate dehydrogenase
MLIIADLKTAFAHKAFERLGEVRYLKTPEMTAAAIRDAEIIIVRSETKVGSDLLEGTAVRFVGTATIGFDHVDIDYLRKKGIGFASAPGSNANSVAEYVVAAMLEYAHRRSSRLAGKSIGIVGVGNVGSKVARNAEVLGMRVLLNDPPLASVTHDPRFLPLDALMDADFVTLHVPLTKEGPWPTFHLFDGRRIGQMKDRSVLINTARGAVVETRSLKAALLDGHLEGAVLDVWEDEPAIDGGLLGLVDIGTPHIAGFSLDGKINAGRMLFDAACRHFGVDAVWKEIQTIPPPRNERLSVSDNMHAEEMLRLIIRQCYNILEDDSNLRAVLPQPANERPRIFRALRADYGVRREFFNYTVTCSGSRPELCRILNTLGFKIL